MIKLCSTFVVIQFFCLSIWAQKLQISFPFESGHLAGRTDSAYGTYFSVFPLNQRKTQEKILEFESLIRGIQISNPHSTSEITTETAENAGQLYLLESYCLALMKEIGNDPQSWNRDALINHLNRLYKEIRILNEKHFENMVRFIDLKFPGPNGLQNKVYSPKYKAVVYSPNYRIDEKLSPDQKIKLYNEKLNAYIQDNGNLDEIKTLTIEYYQSLVGLHRFEYVEMDNGEIFVTQGNAGHILLAKGGRVRAAGQFVILKNDLGETLHFGISNASGSYKPDIYNIELLAQRISQEFQINPNTIVTTKGEPLGLQIVKILLKGLKTEKDTAKNFLAQYKSQSDLILNDPTLVELKETHRCSSLFN